MIPIPDPNFCHAAVYHHLNNWGHYRQCGRKHAVKVDGYHLCTQHAKIARTYGKITIITGPGRQSWSPETKVVTAGHDEALVRARREQVAKKERDDHARSDWRVIRKQSAIIQAMLNELIQLDGEHTHWYRKLIDAHVDDVEGMIERGPE